jgi:hypothetical protein
LADAEWGLITGYNSEQELYYTLTNNGTQATLPFNKLGQNGIDILSVTIPEDLNDRKRHDVISDSLKAALAHADGKEWIDDRPEYQNGLAAYDLWASVFQKWAMIIKAGKSNNIGVDILYFANYYASHIYSARCYARDYLEQIAEDNTHLINASEAYGEVADSLKPIWTFFSDTEQYLDAPMLESFAQNILDAKSAEQEAIDYIWQYFNKAM